MDAISSNASSRRYERDFLLQLRLHPFSLQKPKSLINQDIVKDKLYLHQVDYCPGSQNTNLPSSRSSCQSSVKTDSEMMFRSHRFMPDFYPRSCPLYASGYKGNTGYHGVSSSKSRPFYIPDCINPVRKGSVPVPSECKFDLSLEDIFSPNWPQTIPWSKQGSTYEEVWNSYNRPSQSNASKDHSEVPVKNKKTLPIIDPANGKNILEGILSSPSVSQESVEENDSEPKCRESSPELEEQVSNTTKGNAVDDTQTATFEGISQNGISGDAFCIPQATKKVDGTQGLYLFPGEDEHMEVDSQNPNGDRSENTLILENGLDMSKEETLKEKSIGDFSTKKHENEYENKFVYNNCEEAAENNTTNTDILKDKENRYNHTLPLSERNSSFLSSRTEDQFKANTAILREKLYSMRQEQQKMVIFQSFLRYKKQQLDEIFRNLDDQKIEIANWECNLSSKDKRLKEKEGWLEAKRMDLKHKEEELLAREKTLAREGKAEGPTEDVVQEASRGGVFENGIGELDEESCRVEGKFGPDNAIKCNGVAEGMEIRKDRAAGYGYERKN